MRCTDPRTVGFQADGKTICWSQKHYSKEYAPFQLPCGQCLECRLEYARQWAIRCVHESKMYDENAFITLTYSDKHLLDPKLNYRDFQLFAMRLRSHIRAKIRKKFGQENWKLLSPSEKREIYEKHKVGIFVTGEYGDETKRPHWHAIIFNWYPEDAIYLRKNERDDKIYKSKILDQLWGKNDPEKKPNEVGAVTFHSAGYVARYAAKKLVHGHDQEHEYHPISKKSSHQAIGKKWLEKYWPDCFNFGNIILEDGRPIGSIPRYYEKWLKQNKPEEYRRYVTQTKQNKIEKALEKSHEERLRDSQNLSSRLQRGNYQPPIKRNEVRQRILLSKFKQLQSKRQKGD